jgi:hypothetical protein
MIIYDNLDWKYTIFYILNGVDLMGNQHGPWMKNKDRQLHFVNGIGSSQFPLSLLH